MKAKKIIALGVTAAMAVSAFAACSESEVKDAAEDVVEAVEDAVDEEEEDAGFTEIPIFEDDTAAFMNVSAVYFQPVPMSDGTRAEDYDIHLEADIAANENDFGYELGSWVPYLTVDYKVVAEDGSVAAEGTFMEMAASDGPHYGANIALPDAGTYELSIIIHSPAENDYLIHTDALTGPGAQSFDEAFPDGAITVTHTWNYEGPVTV